VAESGAPFLLAGLLLAGNALFAFFATRGESDDDLMIDDAP
jgi:hypothetical protein